MGNINQAPVIKYNGQKLQDPRNWGKAIRTHELEAAIMNGLGSQDMAALKVMLFLTGNAEGFVVHLETILQRCNMKKNAYYAARTKLEEKGWISVRSDTINGRPQECIVVNYDRIYGFLSNSGDTTKLSNSANTPILSNSEDTTKLGNPADTTKNVEEFADDWNMRIIKDLGF